MADVANPQVIDSLTIENLKTIAGAGAESQASLARVVSSALGILVQDSVASAGRRNNMADVAMAQMLKSMSEIDPTEAVSMAKTLSSTLPEVLAQLGSAVAALQQISKTAQTTPPVTP
jgi:hypothetical protein